MEENLIFEFVKNRFEKGESTGPRHVHIRFDLEILQAEKMLDILCQKNKILKFYDKDYQEERYVPRE